MALLCLDVGFGNMGCAVVENGAPVYAKTITTKKSGRKTTRTADDYAWRSAQIARELVRIVDEYQCQGIVGELPSGGAQDARSMAMMNMATAIVATVAELKDIPSEWCTPGEVKKAVTGKAGASKTDIMAAVIDKFGGAITYKTVRTGKGGSVRKDPVYHFLGRPMGASVFEHIADSIGVYMALRAGNLVKLFG